MHMKEVFIYWTGGPESEELLSSIKKEELANSLECFLSVRSSCIGAQDFRRIISCEGNNFQSILGIMVKVMDKLSGAGIFPCFHASRDFVIAPHETERVFSILAFFIHGIKSARKKMEKASPILAYESMSQAKDVLEAVTRFVHERLAQT